MDAFPLTPVLAMTGMQIVWIIVVGGLIGWVASMIMGTNAQMGLLMNIIVGIVGAALGHFLANTFGIAAGDTLGNILIMLGGAVVLILILKALRVLR